MISKKIYDFEKLIKADLKDIEELYLELRLIYFI